jgi:hypothetical protein
MQRQPGDAIVVRRSIRFIGKVVIALRLRRSSSSSAWRFAGGALIGEPRTTATTASPRTNPRTPHVTVSAATAPTTAGSGASSAVILEAQAGHKPADGDTGVSGIEQQKAMRDGKDVTADGDRQHGRARNKIVMTARFAGEWPKGLVATWMALVPAVIRCDEIRPMIQRVLAWTRFDGSCWQFSAQAAEPRLTIKRIRSDAGELLIGLYADPDGLAKSRCRCGQERHCSR